MDVINYIQMLHTYIASIICRFRPLLTLDLKSTWDIANYIRQKVENGSTNQRLSMEVIERLKQLIPIMLDARSKNHTATLRDDQLYVDGNKYLSPPVQ